MSKKRTRILIASLCGAALVAWAVLMAVVFGKDPEPKKPASVSATPTATPTNAPENKIKVWLQTGEYHQDPKLGRSCLMERVYDPVSNQILITSYTGGVKDTVTKIEPNVTTETQTWDDGSRTKTLTYDHNGRCTQWVEEKSIKLDYSDWDSFEGDPYERTLEKEEYEYYDNGNRKRCVHYWKTGDGPLLMTLEVEYDELGRYMKKTRYSKTADGLDVRPEHQSVYEYDPQHEKACAVKNYCWNEDTQELEFDRGERLIYDEDGSSRLEIQYGADAEWLVVDRYDPQERIVYHLYQSDGSWATVNYTGSEIILTLHETYDDSTSIAYYDKDGRLLRAKSDGVLTWEEDSADPILTSIRTTYEYDTDGRLVKIDHRVSEPDGKLCEWSGITTLTYDDGGRLIMQEFTDKEGKVTSRYEWVFDGRGNLTAQITSSEGSFEYTYTEVEVTEEQYDAWMKRRDDIGDKETTAYKVSTGYFDPLADLASGY